MKGGKRQRSGRKKIQEEYKKKGVNVYLTLDEIDFIKSNFLGNNLSTKVRSVIKVGINNYLESMKNVVRYIDLFAGLGGIRIGLNQALSQLGIEGKCVLTSEIKKHALKAYTNNFSEENIVGDITQVQVESIPDFEVLLAGFPCQPFSAAGNRLGFKDTRGTLFFEIERILRAKKPYAFILENVEGLVTHDGGRTLGIMLEILASLGYKVTHKLLDARDFGLAQSRKRVYLVGTLDTFVSLEDFELSQSSFKDIQEHGVAYTPSEFSTKLLQNYPQEQLYGKSIKDKRGGKDNIHSWDLELKGAITSSQKQILNQLLKERRKKKWAEEIGIKWMDGMPLTCKQIATFVEEENLQELLDDLVQKGYLSFEHPKDLVNGKRVYIETKPKGYNIVTGKLSFEFSKILDPHEVTPTLVATDVEKLGVIDGDGIRKLTLREGLRLCGFPEDYSLDSVSYRQGMDLLGNTVCIPVIEQIALRVGKLFKEKFQH
ncbi:DNA (cytosine-5-)-methyltransferase [Psittacicella gerlachiana]|uniref:Cytosine-specific methyltransferase n=1 Tax=Psittacicella gerlachiana TaxID=2028574 RepID=A0A3A1Y886_9GAMM|nr:DNA (cytosine-5-)-methyltransferase [Psittacicella gerlachiana]RIY33751.1 DNA (cytosine-5-)-methyltransferase [Psittacicella gerlachiana]